MTLRKILFFLGLILAPLSGGSVYYLYHLQTKEITILQVKANLGHVIEPGTKITNDLLESKVILQKDLPPDPMVPGSVGINIYASKYLYPADPLIASKVTNQELSYKNVDQRIVSIKPLDLGLMGLIQLGDYITISTAVFTLPDVKVIGLTDSAGNVLSIIPQFTKSETDSNALLNIPNTVPVAPKAPDHLLVLVSKENADIISKLSKDAITVIFEKRPSLPDTK